VRTDELFLADNYFSAKKKKRKLFEMKAKQELYENVLFSFKFPKHLKVCQKFFLIL